MSAQRIDQEVSTMHKLTVFNLGNADCSRLDLENGQKLLFDYAATRDPNVPDDRRCDLPRLLREDLGTRTYYDVVAFTHLDSDHICGATEFFRLEHDPKYQGAGRIAINVLWVPAAAIIEPTTNLKPEAQVLQAEARYRLHLGQGIRVFSRPDRLASWLARHGLTTADRANLIIDAGQLVPDFRLMDHGVEFFIHSPFAHRVDGAVIDRNDLSLVFQATFLAGGRRTRLIMSADITSGLLSELIGITLAHGREDRIQWDIFKLPHHCSYLSLSDEKGTDETTPVPAVKWLFESQGQRGGIIVATSDPIPTTDTIQPPHRQAANYYRRLQRELGYQFMVTMEHPSVERPEPIEITIDGSGATPLRRNRSSGASVISRPAPRAG
jgi:hypothetical protein